MRIQYHPRSHQRHELGDVAAVSLGRDMPSQSVYTNEQPRLPALAYAREALSISPYLNEEKCYGTSRFSRCLRISRNAAILQYHRYWDFNEKLAKMHGLYRYRTLL